MLLYKEGRSDGDFDTGIGNALSAVLVNPEYLFRVELEPEKASAGGAYRISDLELASRLSFFLWSSIPDDELLEWPSAASSATGRARRARAADAGAMIVVVVSTNFAGQWLMFATWSRSTPDVRLVPRFRRQLARQAIRQETKPSSTASARRSQCARPVEADYTFSTSGWPSITGFRNVYGSQFRRVALGPDSHRGGLCGTAASYRDVVRRRGRSPVIRGMGVLNNWLGSAAPAPGMCRLLQETRSPPTSDPPADGPPPGRNPVCSPLPPTMDPQGFALENFDAVGRWRGDQDAGRLVDTAGGPARRQRIQGRERSRKGLASPSGRVRGTLHGAAADVRPGPGSGYRTQARRPAGRS